MVSAVSSNATSSAYHTAVTSARRSAFSQAQHNDPTTTRNGSSSQQPSFATTAARLAAVGGYSAHNALRIPSYNHSSSPSIASSSSSYTSSASGSERSVSPPHSRSSGERFTRSGSDPVSSPNSTSSRNASAGWRGSANVNSRNTSNATYGEALSRPSSSSSSVAPNLAWQSASVARTTSQSGLSGSESDARNTDGTRRHGALSSGRSQTSVDSDGPNPFAITAAHPRPNVYLRRDPLPPPLLDTSAWESAYRANTAEGRRLAKDQEDLVAGIDALGLDRNFNERRLPSTLSPPPPPSDGAWSFKKHITHAPPRGGLVEPEQLRGPSQEYLETVKQGTEWHDPRFNYYEGRRPKLLVLDVNNTLVARKRATSQAAKNATPRPFLSAFLEYICGSDEVAPGVFARRFNVMIWSSAEGDNVRTMCENMGLVSNLGEEAPLLLDMWDRSSMDLTAEQFNSKYPTIKDLTKLWTNKAIRWTPDGLHTLPKPSNGATPATQASTAAASDDAADAAATHPSPSPSPAPSSSYLSSATSAGSNAQETPAAPALKKKDLKWSQLDTVLIDDSPSKACLQPHNHLAITSWKPLNRPPKSPAPHLFNSSPGNNSIEASAPDTCLLQLVGILDDLKNYSNVSATINSNSYEDLGRGDMQHAWRDKGTEILKDLDIKVKQDFDPLWAVRALRRTNHFTSQSNGAIPSAASGSSGTRRAPVGWE